MTGDNLIPMHAPDGTGRTIAAGDVRALVGYVEQRDRCGAPTARSDEPCELAPNHRGDHDLIYPHERPRVCAGGCGLGAEPGDIFCEGCRDGHNRDLLFAGPLDR